MSEQSIAILDFGSQYSHLIARRVREAAVFCELYSCLVTLEELTKRSNIIGIILSGGPASVYQADAPHIRDDVWNYIVARELPVLGICYGFQEIVQKLGGTVSPGTIREFGFAELFQAENSNAQVSPLFTDIPLPSQVWMSHGDKITVLPDGFVTIASTNVCSNAAIYSPSRKICGLQFHPEVTHSLYGKQMLSNFCRISCQALATWTTSSIAENLLNKMRDTIGETSHVIGAVSGGVDSTVAALLLHRSISTRFHAILVDTGLMRKGEIAEVVQRLADHCGIHLSVVDASEMFFTQLAGVTEPERKRKIIGGLFIDVFQREAERIEALLSHESKGEGSNSEGYKIVKFLLQGTLYPDVIESISYKGPSATIKTHHNVGGLPDRMNLGLIEPLRELFKDEVRSLGINLGLHANSIWRHPFPGPGLAIRVLGEVTRERVEILRNADAIVIEELRKSGAYDQTSQAFAVLLPVKSVGVMGDFRTYDNVCAIRCVKTDDFMTADWSRLDYNLLATMSTRIINEVRGINRVTYDISSKPPATIEWE